MHSQAVGCQLSATHVFVNHSVDGFILVKNRMGSLHFITPTSIHEQC